MLHTSVIRCNNNLWLHCVSIGSEYLWLAVGEIQWNQMHVCLWVEGRVGGGRIARMMTGAGTERNGMERVERKDGWV